MQLFTNLFTLGLWAQRRERGGLRRPHRRPLHRLWAGHRDPAGRGAHLGAADPGPEVENHQDQVPVHLGHQGDQKAEERRQHGSMSRPTWSCVR